MEFASPFEVLGYILEVEDDRDPVRHDALRNGSDLRKLAEREGKLTAGADGDEFARILFDLRDDGGLAFAVSPGSEPPDYGRLAITSSHGDMTMHLRVTPAGRTSVLQTKIRDAVVTLAESVSTSQDAIEHVLDELPDSPEAQAARSKLQTARELLISMLGSMGGTAATQAAKHLGIPL